eukprot:711483-Amphidinium_carterae.1
MVHVPSCSRTTRTLLFMKAHSKRHCSTGDMPHAFIMRIHWSIDDLLVPDVDCTAEDVLTAQEVFESLRYLQDPEHPDLSLEQLKVIEEKLIYVEASTHLTLRLLTKAPYVGLSMQERRVFVRFTPTVPTCSVATLIGLTVKAATLL